MITNAAGQYGEKIQKNARNACPNAAMIPTRTPEEGTEKTR